MSLLTLFRIGVQLIFHYTTVKLLDASEWLWPFKYHQIVEQSFHTTLDQLKVPFLLPPPFS